MAPYDVVAVGGTRPAAQ